jgi:multidrug efflux pump subunit AcrA (membrane-fusion protein)
VGAYFIWKVFFAVPPVPASIVILSGRIEGDDSAAAVKPTGRILEVRVREGDRVKAGDIIAVLDDQQIRDREEKAQAVLAGEEAKAVAARDQIAFLEEQLRQNQLQTEQSDVDAQGRVRQAEADMALPKRTRRSSKPLMSWRRSTGTPARLWRKREPSPSARGSNPYPPPGSRPPRWRPPDAASKRQMAH